MAPPFNPNAGGKIVVEPVGGGGSLVNQGGVGIQPGNSLQTAFPPVIPCHPYRERLGPDGEMQLQIGYMVPWLIRKWWADWMLGYSTTLQQQQQPGGAAGQQVPGFPFGGAVLQNNQTLYFLSRAVPYQCPALGYEHFYCSSVELNEETTAIALDPGIFSHDATGNIGNKPVQDYWPLYQANDGKQGIWLSHYVATFSPRKYRVRSDVEIMGNQSTWPNQYELERYVERRKRSSIQNLPLPGPGLIFTSTRSPYSGGGTNAGNPAVGKNIPAAGNFIPLFLMELFYTWHEVPDEPFDAYTTCVATVNSQTFDGARGFRSYAAGTLLCQAPLEVEMYQHTTGRWYWRITYSFLYAPWGHNYFPTANGEFMLATLDGTATGQTEYRTTDFNQLFIAPTPLATQDPNWPGGT